MRTLKSHNRPSTIMVDDADYDSLCNFRWSIKLNRNTWYAYTTLSNKTVYLHQMLLKSDTYQIDHIDRNGLNNQRSNLRLVTFSENQFNAAKRTNTSSKYKGVSWKKGNNKWAANIRFNHKLIYLGLHDTEELAKAAYDTKAKQLYPNIV